MNGVFFPPKNYMYNAVFSKFFSYIFCYKVIHCPNLNYLCIKILIFETFKYIFILLQNLHLGALNYFQHTQY